MAVGTAREKGGCSNSKLPQKHRHSSATVFKSIGPCIRLESNRVASKVQSVSMTCLLIYAKRRAATCLPTLHSNKTIGKVLRLRCRAWGGCYSVDWTTIQSAFADWGGGRQCTVAACLCLGLSENRTGLLNELASRLSIIHMSTAFYPWLLGTPADGTCSIPFVCA
jgi:hypothetical protein